MESPESHRRRVVVAGGDRDSDVSSNWSVDSYEIYTSRGDFASWTDVGVELVTIPSGPGRSLEDSSDTDSDSDDGLEELVSILWVHRGRLAPLLRTENLSFAHWEHLLCFMVSKVLHIPLNPGSVFHGQPNTVADIHALASFLEGVGRRLLQLLFVGGIRGI